MTARPGASEVPAGASPAGELRVAVYGVPWGVYEDLLALRGEARTPRMAYLTGALELTAAHPQLLQEYVCHVLAALSPNGAR